MITAPHTPSPWLRLPFEPEAPDAGACLMLMDSTERGMTLVFPTLPDVKL